MRPCKHADPPCERCEKNRAKSRQHYADNKSRVSEYNKRRYAVNRDAFASAQRARYARDREKILAKKRARPRTSSDKARSRKWQGVVDAHKFPDILAAQGGVCALCTRPATCCDHDHDTGAIRGALCNSCNVGLGAFRDDPDRLRRAAEYLEVSACQASQK